MASITRAGGPTDWREAFLSHPGLAVTPENYEQLLAAEAGAKPGPEAGPEPAPAAAPESAPAAEPAKTSRSRSSLA